MKASNSGVMVPERAVGPPEAPKLPPKSVKVLAMTQAAVVELTSDSGGAVDVVEPKGKCAVCSQTVSSGVSY